VGGRAERRAVSPTAAPYRDRCRLERDAPAEEIAAAAGDGRTLVARVVIPAYRATRTIRDCVCAVLSSTISASCEIVVVDDGENGDLAAALAGLPVTIVSAFSGSAAAARNRGAEYCTAPCLVFVDADVLVEPSCLDRLIAPIRDGRADATVGNYSRNVAGLSFGGRYKQLYIACANERRRPYLYTFWSAIGAVDARGFAAVGGFDTAFKGANGEDAELGARLSAKGFRIVPVANAKGQHRHSLTLRQLITNDWRKGIVAVRHYRRNNVALSDNCHATRRDKLAVGMATIMLPALLAAVSVGDNDARALWLGLGPSVMLYLAARADLLRILWSSGPGFASAAFPLMFALDYLRGACVVVGLLSRPSAAAGRTARAREPRAAGEHTGAPGLKPAGGGR
jgi:GT2 family glycosyltransferase